MSGSASLEIARTTTIPSHMVIVEYLNKVQSCEREKMKSDLLKLRSELFKSHIILPLDFQPYGKKLYSESFNQDISYLNSAGVIEEKPGSIIYEITERGKEMQKERSRCYENISRDIIDTFDSTLSKLIGA
jgi:hypothetical protein